MSEAALSISVLSIRLSQSQLLLEILQVTLVRHLRVEAVRTTTLDDVPPACSTRTCAFECASQNQCGLFESTRIGGHFFRVRPESFNELVSGDVAAALEVQQRKERLGFAAREVPVDGDFTADVGSQRPEYKQLQHWHRRDRGRTHHRRQTAHRTAT